MHSRICKVHYLRKAVIGAIAAFDTMGSNLTFAAALLGRVRSRAAGGRRAGGVR
ncbi:hypothetical protein Z948_2739 [Sulfitobacter donghicola DSW-25 = KCTC 12864 = JCM 14565]|nr:hypothetical protein Z948_2739 [Sulfitobacter donghicola DSW-25 = KCTC 12864 = JCM 14565]